jgi:histidinol-phosphate/aromatic aminotransferase/cobyric acid decarboxylase-like protein/GTP:adenosylcobinamide-phosphate guanylyltransferase
MQAIILAAGMGRRLQPLTNNVTKCMVKVNGVTLIERMLAGLDALGLSRVVLVTGYRAETLRRFVSSLPLATPVEYVHNEVYDTTNNIYSLYLARRYLTEDATLLLESDLIFDEKILHRLVEHPYPSLVMVAKFESWMDGTVVQLDENDGIRAFLDKNEFVFDDIPTYYKTVNIYKFSQSFSTTHYVPFLEAYSKALGNKHYYEQVLKVIALLERPEIKAIRLNGEAWYEIDDMQDLDIAESIFAPPAEKYRKFQSRYGGYWRYPDILDFHYLVNPFFPPKRLVDEMKSNFERLLVQYPSGLHVNSLLAAKFFKLPEDCVVVGNGAAELIKSVLSLVLGRLGTVLPTFEEYLNRKPPSEVLFMDSSESNFSYTADSLMEFFSDRDLDILALVNPDNPSGNFIPKNDLLRLCAWAAKRSIRLIVDESFVDFADAEASSLLDAEILNRYPNLIVIRSISKSFGVPGIRLGVAASSDPVLIEDMKRDVAIWNINAYGEFFMQIFEKYQEEYYASMSLFKEVRRDFAVSLGEIPYLTVHPSQANYLLCGVSAPYDSFTLAWRLLDEHRILIRDLSEKRGFNGASYCRIAVKNREENARMLKALRTLLK